MLWFPETGHCKSWTLDSGLDRGLDHGLDSGLERGLLHVSCPGEKMEAASTGESSGLGDPEVIVISSDPETTVKFTPTKWLATVLSYCVPSLGAKLTGLARYRARVLKKTVQIETARAILLYIVVL